MSYSYKWIYVMAFFTLFSSHSMQPVKEDAGESRTSIISYKMDKMTTYEIESLIQNLKAECNCDVEHLSAIGALILTHDKNDRTYSIGKTKGNLMKHLDDRMNIEDDDDLDWLPIPDDPDDVYDPNLDAESLNMTKGLKNQETKSGTYTLQKKRFAFNEMFQRNASKFAIFYVYKKTHVVFFVFHFVQLYIFTL